MIGSTTAQLSCDNDVLGTSSVAMIVFFCVIFGSAVPRIESLHLQSYQLYWIYLLCWLGMHHINWKSLKKVFNLLTVGVQLEFVSIRWVIIHMTYYRSSSLVEITAVRLESKSCKGFFWQINFPPMRAL